MCRHICHETDCRHGYRLEHVDELCDAAGRCETRTHEVIRNANCHDCFPPTVDANQQDGADDDDAMEDSFDGSGVSDEDDDGMSIDVDDDDDDEDTYEMHGGLLTPPLSPWLPPTPPGPPTQDLVPVYQHPYLPHIIAPPQADHHLVHGPFTPPRAPPVAPDDFLPFDDADGPLLLNGPPGSPLDSPVEIPWDRPSGSPLGSPFGSPSISPPDSPLDTPPESPLDSPLYTPWYSRLDRPLEISWDRPSGSSPLRIAPDVSLDSPPASPLERSLESPFESPPGSRPDTPSASVAESLSDSPMDAGFRSLSQGGKSLCPRYVFLLALFLSAVFILVSSLCEVC